MHGQIFTAFEGNTGSTGWTVQSSAVAKQFVTYNIRFSKHLCPELVADVSLVPTPKILGIKEFLQDVQDATW